MAKKLKTSEDVKKETIEVIPFNKGSIHVEKNRIRQLVIKTDKNGHDYIASEELILDGKLQLDKKTFDYKTKLYLIYLE